MSHFSFEADLNSALKMDAPVTCGSQTRWERKMSESMNASRNLSVLSASDAKTPMKTINKTIGTPSKTPSKSSCTKKTGSKKPTPGKGSRPPTPSDRFIPNRGSTQFDMGHFLISNTGVSKETDESMSPSQKEFECTMNANLNGKDLSNAKIMSYTSKPPSAPEGYQNNLKVLYSQTKLPGSCQKTTRHIPQAPDRILDAPDLLDDYYLNLIDWSVNNHLAVSLGGHVYLWNAGSGDIQQLFEMESPDEYISSVSWVKEGNYLAVGLSSAQVQLWDVERQKCMRTMNGHAARVGALSWNNYILSSGSRSGAIHHHDVRVAEHQVAALSGHSQEVCGLKWSPDGRYLASGGNDNLLCVWPAVEGQHTTASQPIYTFTQHQAAVKALAWCPWQPCLLASGGGTADRHIRFWNCNTGSCVNSIDTHSQVCALLWSKDYRELVSSHGFAHYQLTLWKYPSLNKVAELTGHMARVLHMALSPDGSTVVSAAADETLRLWKCFAVDPEKQKDQQKSSARKNINSLFNRQRLR